VRKIVSRSVEIWQYEAKNLFLSKTRERPSTGLAVNNTSVGIRPLTLGQADAAHLG